MAYPHIRPSSAPHVRPPIAPRARPSDKSALVSFGSQEFGFPQADRAPEAAKSLDVDGGCPYVKLLLLARDKKTPGCLPFGMLAHRFQREFTRSDPVTKQSDILGGTLKQFLKRHLHRFCFEVAETAEPLVRLRRDDEDRGDTQPPEKKRRGPPKERREGVVSVDIERSGGFILPDTWQDLSIPSKGSEVRLAVRCEPGAEEHVNIENAVSHSDIEDALSCCGALYDIWIAKSRAVVCFQKPQGAAAALHLGTLDLALPLSVSLADNSNLTHSLFLFNVKSSDPRGWANLFRSTHHGVRCIEWHQCDREHHVVVEFATWRSCRTAKRWFDDARVGKIGEVERFGIDDYQYCYLGMILELDSADHPQRRSLVCKVRGADGRRVKHVDAALVMQFVENSVGPVTKLCKPLPDSVQLTLEDADAVEVAVSTLPGLRLPDDSTLECSVGSQWQKNPGIVGRARQEKAIVDSKVRLL